MKNTPFILVLFLIGAIQCKSQPDSSASLLNSAQNKLKEGATISSILTNKDFLSIHSDTKFRNLIRDNANPSVLSIATAGEPGTKIMVTAQIVNESGAPVPNALVYLYQTDARGWYSADAPHITGNEGDMGHARLFGYVRTDAQGKLVLETIKPSGYPKSDLPAHIHVHVWAEGYRNYVNEFLFDDDTRLTGEIRQQAIQNRLHIAKPAQAGSPFGQQFNYTIQLQKNP